MDLGHWTCDEQWEELPFGFVYLITNTVSDMKYIGKKQIEKKTKRPPLKGKKRKRIIVGESDWKTYTGSSDRLNADIAELGKEKFKREIMFFCKSKAECSYIEAREQFARKVLESNDYYNGHIRVRVHGKGILKS